MIERQQARMGENEADDEDLEDEKEVLLSIAKVLETILGQREYLIKLKGIGP